MFHKVNASSVRRHRRQDRNVDDTNVCDTPARSGTAGCPITSRWWWMRWSTMGTTGPFIGGSTRMRIGLEERPRGICSIPADEWRDPLGDAVRTGDWLNYFDRELAGEPWREVLVRWWPRLLPGIAAGATHRVIRVGHAVRALLDNETARRVAELGQGLAYWAARWQPLAPPGAGP